MSPRGGGECYDWDRSQEEVVTSTATSTRPTTFRPVVAPSVGPPTLEEKAVPTRSVLP